MFYLDKEQHPATDQNDEGLFYYEIEGLSELAVPTEDSIYFHPSSKVTFSTGPMQVSNGFVFIIKLDEGWANDGLRAATTFCAARKSLKQIVTLSFQSGWSLKENVQNLGSVRFWYEKRNFGH